MSPPPAWSAALSPNAAMTDDDTPVFALSLRPSGAEEARGRRRFSRREGFRRWSRRGKEGRRPLSLSDAHTREPRPPRQRPKGSVRTPQRGERGGRRPP